MTTKQTIKQLSKNTGLHPKTIVKTIIPGIVMVSSMLFINKVMSVTNSLKNYFSNHEREDKIAKSIFYLESLKIYSNYLNDTEFTSKFEAIESGIHKYNLLDSSRSLSASEYWAFEPLAALLNTAESTIPQDCYTIPKPLLSFFEEYLSTDFAQKAFFTSDACTTPTTLGYKYEQMIEARDYSNNDARNYLLNPILDISSILAGTIFAISAVGLCRVFQDSYDENPSFFLDKARNDDEGESQELLGNSSES
ncbi:MAG: hypothetical protein SFT93_03270 [Rickettsiaceae bacterium]|nr:hypothetical protein [Rickettsiaceae bacterium]